MEGDASKNGLTTNVFEQYVVCGNERYVYYTNMQQKRKHMYIHIYI